VGRLQEWWARLEERLQGNAWRWLVLAILLGVGLMIIASFLTVKEVQPTAEPRADSRPQTAAQKWQTVTYYEEEYSRRLQTVLEQVAGIGEVEVFVNVDSTDEVIVEKNRQDTQQVTNEKDRQGATRQVTELARDGEVVTVDEDGAQRPLILKRIKPRIRGVLVVADGAERATVRKLLVEAVERSLDVPSHRISVLPRRKS
jgi:stage III sporulation protein AG